jgi:hypothetical protein
MAPAWEEPDEHATGAETQEQRQQQTHLQQRLQQTRLEQKHLASGGNAADEYGTEPGGRSAITGTCERIGKAMGSAQRQMSRGLHLVRGGRVLGFPGPGSSGGAKPGATEAEGPGEEAARLMRSIEDGSADAGHEAARQIGEWRDRAAWQLQRLRCEVLALMDEHPLETIVAIAGACFAVGVALRLSRRSDHG